MPKPRRDRVISYHMFIQKQHIRLVSLNHLYQLQLSFHIAYPPDVPENAFHVGVTLLELFLCLVGMLGGKLPTVCFLFLLTGFLSGFFLSIDATIKARYLAPFGVCLDKDNWLSVSVSGSVMPSIWGWRARLWTSEAWNFLLSGRNSSSTFVIRALKVTWDKILSLDLMVETTWSTPLLSETETALRIPTPRKIVHQKRGWRVPGGGCPPSIKLQQLHCWAKVVKLWGPFLQFTRHLTFDALLKRSTLFGDRLFRNR